MAFKLLSVSADAKTYKGEKLGYLTGVLYLAPAELSGYQTCPKATEGCKAACLNTAGRGIYNKVQQARIKKTKRFFEDRQNFMDELSKDIEALIRKASRDNLIPVVRLNGTSDIAWEKIKFSAGDSRRNIFELFPDIQFYDYTKVVNRKSAQLISNYHLTFSLSENNDADALKALDMGMNVAVVVNIKRNAEKPKTFSGRDAVDGDESDTRFIDGKGKFILLTAKGKARRDASGFVKQLDYKVCRGT